MDSINRQDVIDALRNKIVSTNPDEFYAHDKFIQMQIKQLQLNPEIASYGKWMWANGFNTALIEEEIMLKKLPSAEPDKAIKDCRNCKNRRYNDHYRVSFRCESDDCVGWNLWEPDDLPSAERKGKWIYDGIRGRFPSCKCSACGAYENADWAIMQGADYCPHCGARMEGSE